MLSKCSLDTANGSAVNFDKSSKNDKTPQNDETESNFYDPELKLDGQKLLRQIVSSEALSRTLTLPKSSGQSISQIVAAATSIFCHTRTRSHQTWIEFT